MADVVKGDDKVACERDEDHSQPSKEHRSTHIGEESVANGREDPKKKKSCMYKLPGEIIVARKLRCSLNQNCTCGRLASFPGSDWLTLAYLIVLLLERCIYKLLCFFLHSIIALSTPPSVQILVTSNPALPTSSINSSRFLSLPCKVSNII